MNTVELTIAEAAALHAYVQGDPFEVKFIDSAMEKFEKAAADRVVVRCMRCADAKDAVMARLRAAGMEGEWLIQEAASKARCWNHREPLPA